MPLPPALANLSALPPAERQAVLRTVAPAFSFSDFVRFAWPILEPARPLAWNWHIDLICDAVQSQATWASNPPAYPHLAPFRRLAIFISPGDLKSVLISVLRPAWIWLRFPSRRSLYFSHSKDLARRDSRRTRTILEHPSYLNLVSVLAQALPNAGFSPWSLEDDQNEKHNYATTRAGHRQSFGFDQPFTGARGDDIVIDDPVDAKLAIRASDADLRAAFANANDIIANQMQSRVNSMRDSTWTLMMQRLGEGDPGDVAIADGDWHIICLPKEFNPNHPLRHPADPRTLPGELLNPLHDDRHELDRLKSKMAPRHWLAQYGQLTGSSSGGLFPRSLFASCPRYSQDPLTLAASLDEIAASVDCSFKKSADSDRVSILVKGRSGYGRRFLLHRVCRRMTFTETADALLEINRTWHPAFTLVEAKANGPAILDHLSAAIPALIPFDPGRSSKAERAQSGSAPLYAAHQQVLPDPALFPWVADFEEAHVQFTGGNQSFPDDDIDAESQLDLYWTQLSRQAPWLALPATPDPPAPAWAHPNGLSRHFLFSPATLLHETSLFLLALVPPTPLSQGVAILSSNHGDLVGHAIAPSHESLVSATLDLCRSASAIACPSASRKPLDPFLARIVLAHRPDPGPADRLLETLQHRGLRVHHADSHSIPWLASKGALAAAADRARSLLDAAHLHVHDPMLHRLLRRATLHPTTGVPEVPRTQDLASTYMGAPLRIDAILLASLACLDLVAELRSNDVRQATIPAEEGDFWRTYYENLYGPGAHLVREGPQSVWSALTPKR